MSADPRAALLAWCDETERVAREASPEPWDADGWVYGDARTESYGVWAGEPDAAHPRDPIAKTTRFDQGGKDATHIARHDPPSVLAQVAAIRAVVEAHRVGEVFYPYCVTCGTPEGRWPCTTLLELADGFAPRLEGRWLITSRARCAGARRSSTPAG
jgi:hypothetical protein